MKYRRDKAVEQPDGSIAWYALWVGGPTLSAVSKCRIDGTILRLAVYVSGDADTFYSIPAYTRVRGKRVRGYITRDEQGYLFVPYTTGGI